MGTQHPKNGSPGRRGADGGAAHRFSGPERAAAGGGAAAKVSLGGSWWSLGVKGDGPRGGELGDLASGYVNIAIEHDH